MILVFFGPVLRRCLESMIVTSPISLSERRPLVHPVITPPAIRLRGLDPMVLGAWQMLHQIAEMLAIRELAGARCRKHIPIAQSLQQAEGLVAANPASASTMMECAHAGGTNSLSIRRNKNVLLPLALRVNDGEGDRHPKVSPTGNQQDHLKTVAKAAYSLIRQVRPNGCFCPALLRMVRSGWWMNNCSSLN